MYCCAQVMSGLLSNSRQVNMRTGKIASAVAGAAVYLSRQCLSRTQSTFLSCTAEENRADRKSDKVQGQCGRIFRHDRARSLLAIFPRFDPKHSGRADVSG